MTIIITPTATREQRMQYRQEWMIAFSDEVRRLMPSNRAPINWINAQVAFNAGTNVLDAAVAYAASITITN